MALVLGLYEIFRILTCVSQFTGHCKNVTYWCSRKPGFNNQYFRLSYVADHDLWRCAGELAVLLTSCKSPIELRARGIDCSRFADGDCSRELVMYGVVSRCPVPYCGNIYTGFRKCITESNLYLLIFYTPSVILCINKWKYVFFCECLKSSQI